MRRQNNSAFVPAVALFFSMHLSGCGNQNQSHLKIYNGVEVAQDHWSTQITARIDVTRDGQVFSCSAGVVGTRALLSNSHCFTRKDGSKGEVTEVVAHFGNLGTASHIKASWWNYFEKKNASASDISLIELSEDVPSFVKPAFIADSSQALVTGWLSGFGSDAESSSGGGKSGVLRVTSLNCKKPAATQGRLQKNCVSNWDQTPGAASRPGDSGGPVTLWNEELGRQYVVGLNWGMSGNDISLVIDVSKARKLIQELNTQCRLEILNLSC